MRSKILPLPITFTLMMLSIVISCKEKNITESSQGKIDTLITDWGTFCDKGLKLDTIYLAFNDTEGFVQRIEMHSEINTKLYSTIWFEYVAENHDSILVFTDLYPTAQSYVKIDFESIRPYERKKVTLKYKHSDYSTSSCIFGICFTNVVHPAIGELWVYDLCVTAWRE